MQSSSQPAGQLIATYRHGKAFLIFTLGFSLFMLGLAAFVLYLQTILPVADTGPVIVESSGRRGMTMQFSSQSMMIYCTAAFLAFVAACMFGIYLSQRKLRRPTYEVYEHGIAQVIGAQKDYVPYVEIEDLYLFGSGQTATSGLVTNVAWRRNASEPFRRVTASLKGFEDFQLQVRELYVRERLPVLLNALQAGSAVTFNCMGTGQLWFKRIVGNFLSVTTQPLRLTRNHLEFQGRQVPVAQLRSVDLNAWTEKVVIKDEAGKPVLSAVATAIMSHDLLLNTLDALLQAEPTPYVPSAPLPA
ncbi:hypothetical protein [Pseudomonas ovata]|uniref:hypothetical protein n=1 Tax=Pseudomonas ovata TaxID=1839709 RepID=UPI000D69693D|nr:hypothetical protein [Pseudomonas ovata]